MASIRLSRLTRADLQGIWRYTAETWSPAQARKYHSEIVETIYLLAAGERNGRNADLRPGDLKYSVGSHFIYYRISDAGLHVIRILHQRMDASRHL